MQFNNFREPVEFIVNKLDKKKKTKINVIEDANNSNLKLPEYPVNIIRNSNNKVEKVVYAKGTSKEWSEELIRNSKGQVYRIKTVFSDGSSKTIEIFKNNNLVDYIDYV